MRDRSADDSRALREGVLIVSDDPSEASRLGLFLEPLGRRLLEVTADRDLLHAAMDQDVTVVVIDARGSVADGLDAVRRIRSQDGAAITPVVLITESALAARSASDSAHPLGAVDVLAAPITPDVLRSRVAVLDDLAIRCRALARLAGQQRALLDAQRSVVRALADEESGDVVMARVARTVALRLGWAASAYWVSSDSEPRCIAVWSDASFAPPTRDRLHAAAAHGHPDGILRRAWASGRPEWRLLTGGAGDDAYSRAAHEAGLAGALAVPVNVRSGSPGVVELLSRSRQPPDQQMLASLVSVAALVARVLDARRAHTEAEVLKNEFFALVPHELLTPLTSILGYLEDLLADPGGLTAEQRHDLQIVDRNARRLNRLVDGLIFVAQMEAGRTSIERTSLDLADVVIAAVETARSLAQRRDVDIRLRMDPVAPVRGDRKRLEQVVDNLLSNAMKFSHPGGAVDVTLRPAGRQAVVEVRDRGIGIPPAEQEHVFERYFRSSAGMAHETGGAGLGLSITKAIVEAHGGSIELVPTGGAGSTFRVSLPIEAFDGGFPDAPGELR
jgi:signal transduction histidine kinase